MAFSFHHALMGLVGGLMIGAASALLLLVNGRVAGISGILGGVLAGSAEPEWREKAAFLVGLVAAPAVWAATVAAPTITVAASAPVLILAGLLVGFGTRLGSGCTSGHGVCGLSRLSPRSFAATGTFMAVAAATVAASRLVGGGAP